MERHHGSDATGIAARSHRDKNGENGAYLAGLSWLARGALLLGNVDKARSYTADVRRW